MSAISRNRFESETIQKTHPAPPNKRRQRIFYSFGDAGFNIYWEFAAQFALFFLTDIAHLAASTATTALLIGKCVDLFAGPVMGRIADRTHTRFGHYRPYLLWCTPGLAAAFCLLLALPSWKFTAGGTSTALLDTLSAALAVAIFFLFYSGGNIPYNALLAVTTESEEERSRTAGLRFAFAFVAVLFVQSMTMKLVEILGGRYSAGSWLRVALIDAVLASILLYLCFQGTTERTQSSSEPSHAEAPFSFAVLLDTRLLMALAGIMIAMMAFGCRSAVNLYFVSYVLQRPTGLSLFLGLSSCASFLACSALPVLAGGRRTANRLAVFCCVGGAASSILLAMIPTAQWAWILAAQIAFGCTTGALLPILFGMVAGLSSELSLAKKLSLNGTIAAAALIALKLGAMLGSASVGFALARFGYAPGATQTPLVRSAILSIASVAPACLLLLAGITVFRIKPHPDGEATQP